MEVLDSGVIGDGQAIPDHRRNCAFTTLNRLQEGTLLVSGRWGSARDSVDGHACIWATPDNGRTWDLRYDGYGKGSWDGTPGELKGLTSTELMPGRLTATALWVDRSDPDLPFIHPDTQGLLPMRIMHVESADGGYTWGPPRRMNTSPHLAASPCSHAIIRLPGVGLVPSPTNSGRNTRTRHPADPRRGCASPGTAAGPGRSTPPWPTIPTTRWPTGTSGWLSTPLTGASSPRSGPMISGRDRTSISISPMEPRMAGRGRSRAAPAFPASTASPCPWAGTGCWPPIRGAGIPPALYFPSARISGSTGIASRISWSTTARLAPNQAPARANPIGTVGRHGTLAFRAPPDGAAARQRGIRRLLRRR